MSEQLFLWLTVLAECAAIGFRVSRLAAHPWDRAERAHLGLYVFGALGVTLMTAPVYTAVDRQVGVPNVALLLAALSLFISAWCVQVFYLFVTRPGLTLRTGLGQWLWMLVGGCVLEFGLFWLADLHDEVAGVLAFRERYGREPAVLGLAAMIYTWSGLAYWNVARFMHYYARLSQRPLSRLGLGLSVAGAVLGVANSVHSEVELIFRSMGWPYPFEPPDALSNGLIASAVLLLVVGTTTPVWGPQLGIAALLAWLADYQAYFGLHRLWRTLCRALPEVVLEAPADPTLRDLLPASNIRFRLYRRLVEVLDARLLLRPYVHPRVLELAAEVGRGHGRCKPYQQAVFVEAVALEVGLAARAAGQLPAKDGVLPPIPSSGGLRDEIDFFCQVARERVHPVLVQAIVAHLSREMVPRAEEDDASSESSAQPRTFGSAARPEA